MILNVPNAWKRTARYAEKIRPHVNEKTGKLYGYSNVGCYPIFYVGEERYRKGSLVILCPECASDPSGEEKIVDCDANWEDPNLFCECGKRIESAYAEDEVGKEESE